MWNPFHAFLDLFNSIKLGIFWMATLILYGALGSAVPQFRQLFELTEFQYFNHWLFFTLIILLCLNLIVATLRRIRFNLRNLGVLSVHLGILTLCAGSVLYFGHKIEGDVWLDAPKIRIVSLDRLKKDPSNAVIGQLIAARGKVWEQTIPMLGGHHRLEVTEVRHSGLKTAAFVKVRANLPNEPEKTVQLALESPGQPHSQITQITERLALMLSGANQSHVFYDDQTPALLVQAGSANADINTFELPSLPYYNEHFVEDGESNIAGDRQQWSVFDTSGRRVASRRNAPWPLLERWRMPISLVDPDSALAVDWPFTLEIDGYLPYAELRQTPEDGGDRIAPIIQVVWDQAGRVTRNWLAADPPAQSQWVLNDQSRIEFRWLAEQSTLPDKWTQPIGGRHYLTVHVKDKNIRKGYDVTVGQRIKIEGTDYTLRVDELRPNWPLMTAGFQGARTPIALVWIESPSQQFQRSVLQRYPQLNQDRDKAGKKIKDGGGLVDDNIEITYTDASSDHFMIVAGAELSPTLIYTAPGGHRTVRRLKEDEPFEVDSDQTELTLHHLIVRPRFESTATVIPTQNRRSLSDVRRQQSVIRLHLHSKDDQWSRHIWIPFSQYNSSHDMTPATVVHDVPGVGDLRFIYGRATHPLSTTLCLEQLQTDYYPGGRQASGWSSYFRYTDPQTGQVRRGKAFLNNTFTIGDWTYFQSGAPNDGESWTVLGVGNRRGIVPMLLGCILITLGMLYAFCVKPILVQRRRDYLASLARGKSRETRGTMTKSKQPVEHSPVGKEVVTPTLLMIASLTLALVTPLQAAERTPIIRTDGQAGPNHMLAYAEGPAPAEQEKTASSPTNPAADLAAIQNQIDIKTLGAMALLDQAGWRFTTVDSWSRKVMQAIYGSKAFYGLDPVVAAMELIFNNPAYQDQPVIYVKDKGILRDLTKYPIEVSEEQRKKIYHSRRVSYDFLASPAVHQRLDELSGNMIKNRAMGRLDKARYHFENLGFLFSIIPNPKGQRETAWSSFFAIHVPSMRAKTGLDDSQAQDVLAAFTRFGHAWINRDVKGINAGIAKLNKILPPLAPPGVYPSSESRLAELRYRRLDLLWWAWLVYIFSFFVSIFAVATRYRWARPTGLFLLFAAMGLHGYDLFLRWQVLDRIPVANMYEAIVSSTLAGALLGLILELFSRKRIYLLSSSLLGFFALTLPILLPDKINNNLQTMMPILDDVMLRIHTVLIISSYAVITLAYGVANCYLFVSAFRDRTSLARGMIGAQAGAIVWLVAAKLGVFEDSNMLMVTSASAAAMAGGVLLALGLFAMFGRKGAVVANATDSTLSAGSPGSHRNGGFRAADFPIQRDVLDEFDRSHRVLLYIAVITLFVGLVLGAVWADYSWGRPWGWDPKEVFALNTWLIYAILIHARFVTRRRALWTSVLSVLGFAAMQFNWWVVNFYIVGLHSYA